MAINLACENNTFGLKITQYLNRFFVHNIIKADLPAGRQVGKQMMKGATPPKLNRSTNAGNQKYTK
jgi:hypothetical protein